MKKIIIGVVVAFLLGVLAYSLMVSEDSITGYATFEESPNAKLDSKVLAACETNDDCVKAPTCCPICSTVITDYKYINKKYTIELDCSAQACEACTERRTTGLCDNGQCGAAFAFGR